MRLSGLGGLSSGHTTADRARRFNAQTAGGRMGRSGHNSRSATGFFVHIWRIFPDYLGDYGRRGRFPFKSLLGQGWRLSGSSDVWIGSEREATNPLLAFGFALNDRLTAASHRSRGGTHAWEALRMHTLDAAATLCEDYVRGSIAPGKFADIIALERDPFAVSIDDLRTLKVDFVMSMGREVFKREGAFANG